MTEVVCALILKDGKLLVVQYGPKSKHPWKWEFPGGKINPGEAPAKALVREIREELDIVVEVEESLDPVSYHYDTGIIRLIPFICNWTSGSIQTIEHHAVKWVSPGEILNFDLLEADIEMINSGENLGRLMNKTRKK